MRIWENEQKLKTLRQKLSAEEVQLDRGKSIEGKALFGTLFRRRGDPVNRRYILSPAAKESLKIIRKNTDKEWGKKQTMDVRRNLYY